MVVWQTPEGRPLLGEDEVHVWRAALDLPPATVRALHATLSLDERIRAEGFHFRGDRDHFVAARGILRSLLAGHLGTHPASLRFRYGEHGKPALARGSVGERECGSVGDRRPNAPTSPLPCAGALRFNVSHSGGVALIALARGRDLGVDVEQVRPEFAEERVAQMFFSAREVAELQALPPDARPLAFFHCWTRKEAYVKATGRGLSLPLHQFDVSLAPGEPACLRCTRWDPGEAQRWSLVALDAGPGHTAALAVEGRGWALRCYGWE